MVALDRLKQRLRDALAGPNTFKVVTNAGWLYADQALRALLGVLVFSFVTRSLGPEQFGVLSYALAFPLGYGGVGLWLGLVIGLVAAGASLMLRFWALAPKG